VSELRVGDPRLLAVDVGPVIDRDAQGIIERHIDAMRAKGHAVTRPAVVDGEATSRGSYVPPAVIEIDHIAELQREVFGPVLHILRYQRSALTELVEQINATGYGLTMGVHTRIDETLAQVVTAARVGNLYANRNIVGAVVGVQPFGGEGLSGTGPKAGGPLYLLRLLRRRPADAARRATLADSDAHASPSRSWTPGPAPAESATAGAALRAWAQAQGEPHLAQVCSDFALQAPTAGWRALRGPTGEANLYATLPRDAVLCLAASGPAGDADRLTQLAAVLAVGGRAVWPDDAQALRERLPDAVKHQVSLAQDWQTSPVHVDAVLHHGAPAELAALLQTLAQRPGPIVGVTALASADTAIALERLLIERSLSINTAAAGGNASLMTIG